MVKKSGGYGKVKGYGKKKIGYFSENLIDSSIKLQKQVVDLETEIVRIQKAIDDMNEFYEGNLGGGLVSKVTGVFGIGSLVMALYFLTPNFTGNVIGSFEMGNSNLYGMGLFLFGLVNVFLCLKKK